MLLELLHKARHMDTSLNIKAERELPCDETVQQASFVGVEDVINIKEEVIATAIPKVEEEGLPATTEEDFLVDVKEEYLAEEYDAGEAVLKDIEPDKAAETRKAFICSICD
ncbi:uncharacterized protein [Anabrus simplex]|uniref:uncharacterized protein n=1 Tax=Anabrus simplex TaxID=316456 RepID=UPI0035A266EB